MAFQFLVETGLGQQMGVITVSGLPSDANTIIINDGKNSAVTFEFESGGGITSGNVSVSIGGDSNTTATNLVTEITSQRLAGNLDITAVNTSGSISLHNINVIGGSILSGPSLNGITIITFQTPTSYVTLEEANTFLTPNIHATSWFALSNTQKKQLLAFSTIFLDNRVAWNGRKSVPKSGLRWPITGIINRDCVLIEPDEIPEQLKYAVAATARYMVDQDRTIERAQDGIEELIVDVIEFVFREGYKLPVVPTELQYLLEGLGNVRGGSSTFAKIIRA